MDLPYAIDVAIAALWMKAVDQLWHLAVENLCKSCIRKMFLQKDQRDILHRPLLDDLNDII